MKLLTQKEYARRRRITPQRVSALVREGRIRLKQGRVDPEQADRARAARTQASTPRPRQRGNAHGGGRPAREPGSNPSAAMPSGTMQLTAARAADATYSARLRKLEFEQRTRELLPASEVLEAERRKNANIRVRFRGLARALAPLMAQTTAAADCERLLLAEIDHQLEELARDPLGLVAPAVPAAPPPAVQTIATEAVV